MRYAESVPPEAADWANAYTPGSTLPAPMYLQPGLFPFEMAQVLADNWWFGRFSAELAHLGEYSLLRIGSASLILVRGRDGTARAFYNSCRHRGATLCRELAGKLTRITCPYHAWSFSLEGELLAAPNMYESFEKSRYPLRAVHVREEAGMIFVNLAQNAPPDFDEFMRPHRDYLDYYEIGAAKVAARNTYIIEANWKLAIENLVECYHCLPSHPGLCAVEGRDELIAFGMDPAGPNAKESLRKIQPSLDALAERVAQHAVPAKSAAGMRERTGLYATQRYPLSKGFETGTAGGQVTLPFLGRAEHSVGSGVRMAFSTTTFLQIYADHAICLSYVPQSATRTVVEQAWLVSPRAVIDEAIRQRLTTLWDGVTREDGALAENQVDGIRQPCYEPGPLSAMESGTRAFLDWYIARVKQGLAGPRAS